MIYVSVAIEYYMTFLDILAFLKWTTIIATLSRIPKGVTQE